MSEGVRETQCTRCAHRHVCKHKEIYLEAIEAVLQTRVNNKPISELEFLNPIELDCKYETNLIQPRL